MHQSNKRSVIKKQYDQTPHVDLKISIILVLPVLVQYWYNTSTVRRLTCTANIGVSISNGHLHHHFQSAMGIQCWITSEQGKSTVVCSSTPVRLRDYYEFWVALRSCLPRPPPRVSGWSASSPWLEKREGGQRGRSRRPPHRPLQALRHHQSSWWWASAKPGV